MHENLRHSISYPNKKTFHSSIRYQLIEDGILIRYLFTKKKILIRYLVEAMED